MPKKKCCRCKRFFPEEKEKTDSNLLLSEICPACTFQERMRTKAVLENLPKVEFEKSVFTAYSQSLRSFERQMKDISQDEEKLPRFPPIIRTREIPPDEKD
jgi:late competence protein required for DNA uptake (superfamily II DNA/RNA helicase)